MLSRVTPPANPGSPALPMWPTIDRARRRISGDSPAPDPEPEISICAPSAPVAPSAPAAPAGIEDVVIVPGGPELERLLRALQGFLGAAEERPDTPARIERALSGLVASRGGTGRARVLRCPAGVSTPEAWEIHLDGIDRETSETIRAATRTGRF